MSLNEEKEPADPQPARRKVDLIGYLGINRPAALVILYLKATGAACVAAKLKVVAPACCWP